VPAPGLGGASCFLDAGAVAQWLLRGDFLVVTVSSPHTLDNDDKRPFPFENFQWYKACRGCSGQNISQLFGPVLLFWYQGFSGAGGQIQVFRVKFGYVMIKFGLHMGYPLLYYTRGGSRRLILQIRPKGSDI